MENISSSNSQKALVPKLRFPEFKETWRKVKLSDIAEGFDYGLNVAATEFNGKNKYIRITDIHNESHKYISDSPVSPKGEIEEQYRVNENDILFARTGASVGKTYLYDPRDGLLYYAGFLIRAKITKADARFVFAQTLTTKYAHWVASTSKRSGQPGINAKEYGSFTFAIPAADEQHRISSFLDLLDQKIEKQRQLVDSLKSYKRGVLEEIFVGKFEEIMQPQGMSIVPLKSVFSKVTKRNSDGSVRNVLTNSAELGLVPQRDYFDKDIAVADNTQNYYIINQGDFVYNPRKSKLAPYGPFNIYQLPEPGIVSPLYFCLHPSGEVNKDYLYWYFQSTAWHRYMYDNGSQGARHDRVSMTDDLLFAIPILLPQKDTQNRVVALLNNLQKLYDSASLSLNHMLQFKEQLLRVLFV